MLFVDLNSKAKSELYKILGEYTKKISIFRTAQFDSKERVNAYRILKKDIAKIKTAISLKQKIS